LYDRDIATMDYIVPSVEESVPGLRNDEYGSKAGSRYKDSFLGTSYVESNLLGSAHIEEMMFDNEDDYLVIKLSKEEKKRIRETYRQTLIIKVMGRKVGYTYLLRCLKAS